VPHNKPRGSVGVCVRVRPIDVQVGSALTTEQVQISSVCQRSETHVGSSSAGQIDVGFSKGPANSLRPVFDTPMSMSVESKPTARASRLITDRDLRERDVPARRPRPIRVSPSRSMRVARQQFGMPYTGFPVRIRIAVPLEGLSSRLDQIICKARRQLG